MWELPGENAEEGGEVERIAEQCSVGVCGIWKRMLGGIGTELPWGRTRIGSCGLFCCVSWGRVGRLGCLSGSEAAGWFRRLETVIFESRGGVVWVWVCSKLKLLLLLLLSEEEWLLSMSARDPELMLLLSLSCCLSCSSCICSLVFLGFRFFLTVGFVCILRCLVNSSDRENRFGHRSKVQR